MPSPQTMSANAYNPADLNALHWYAIDPVDLLLMREAKPFSPGDGSWAKGQFPPLPITVFQALRSATARREGNRIQRNQRFIGPFLIYSPPGKNPTLWLPTPSDLVCVSTRTETEEDSNDEIEKVPAGWKRMERFQPIDPESSVWKFVGFDAEMFENGGLRPMAPPQFQSEQQERVGGRPPAWIRSAILCQYLRGEVITAPPPDSSSDSKMHNKHGDYLGFEDYCHDDPWDVQVLPHIQMNPDTSQVKDEEGYFTEVAIRMRPHWQLVAGYSEQLDTVAVRLGGEGHRALVTPLEQLPQWHELQKYINPEPDRCQTAYVLTPGLAEQAHGDEVYTLLPHQWKGRVIGCVGDRPLLWGGMSTFQRPDDDKPDIAFQPQRAFIQPGTVYRFPEIGPASDQPQAEQLLPDADGAWINTFRTLNYGTLLWGK